MGYNEKEFIEKAVKFLRDYLNNCKKKKVVLGLSGGVDSAVILVLAVKAVGRENIIALSLPNGKKGDDAIKYAKMTAESFNIKLKILDIGPIISKFTSIFDENNPLRIGNIAARCRMITLYNESAKNNALVLGTENRTEHYLGYFTKAGDEVSDIELIRDLWKTQVFKLAEYLGVPEKIIEKPPTADLWEGQTDEDELGIKYREADKVLMNIINGITNKDISKKAVKKVRERMEKIEYKLSETPYPLLK